MVINHLTRNVDRCLDKTSTPLMAEEVGYITSDYLQTKLDLV